MSAGYLPLNLANVQAATGFDYPAGLYMFRIDSTEVKVNNDGQSQRLVVSNAIVMGPGPSTQFAERKLSNSYQLTEKGAPFLKRLFLCCGITEDFIAQNGGNVDPSWLNGRQYVAQVVKNGAYTNITGERAMQEWDSAVQAGGSQAVAATTGHTSPAAAPSLLQPIAAPPQAAPAQMAPAQMAVPAPQMAVPAPAALPSPAAAAPAPAATPMGVPAPAPPPGQVGQQ